jgi:hypothetical protein
VSTKPGQLQRAVDFELAADVRAEQVHYLEGAVGQVEVAAGFEPFGVDAGQAALGQLDLGRLGGDQVDRLVEVAVVRDQRRSQLGGFEVEPARDAQADEDCSARFHRAFGPGEQVVHQLRRELPVLAPFAPLGDGLSTFTPHRPPVSGFGLELVGW